MVRHDQGTGGTYEGIWRALFPAFGDAPDEHVLSDEWIQARFVECYPYDPPYDLVHRTLTASISALPSFAKGGLYTETRHTSTTPWGDGYE